MLKDGQQDQSKSGSPDSGALRIAVETPEDLDQIDQLSRLAFEGVPYSDQTEADIVRGLRSANGLSVSLVAWYEDTLVGHIAFSPVNIRYQPSGGSDAPDTLTQAANSVSSPASSNSSGQVPVLDIRSGLLMFGSQLLTRQWFGLAPVAVHPDFQKHGIGSALITHGLEELNMLNARGCVLLGEPAFYGRFGFKSYSGLFLADVPDGYFQALPFIDFVPQGEVIYHPAFGLKE
jgi:predicted N-acetyltransferase YhbS